MKNTWFGWFVVSLLALLPVSALAGGGGCGEQCDRYTQVNECLSTHLAFTDPTTLPNEWDARSIDSLKRDIGAQLAASLLAVSWSIQSYDPHVFVKAWFGPGAPRQYSHEAFTDRWRLPPAQGYRMDAKTGAFRFAGTTTTGWEDGVFRIWSNGAGAPVLATVSSQTTGAVLVTAELQCRPAARSSR